MDTLKMFLYTIFFGPILIVLSLWTIVCIAPYFHVIVISLIIWGIWRYKKRHSKVVIPSNAKPARPKKVRKPITIKWQGKEIPLIVFVFSTILSVIFGLLLIFCILFVFPPLIGVMIIGFCVGSAIGKVTSKKKK